MRYVYVAGPYSTGDPVVNTRKAIAAGDRLLLAGFVPFIPHLNLIWHIVAPHEPGVWYEWDLEWLAKCDALLRLPGESWGADREVERATALGLPVFRSIKDLLLTTRKMMDLTKGERP